MFVLVQSCCLQTAITSRDKQQAFGPFGDVYEEAYGAAPADRGDPLTGMGDYEEGDGTGPPPTFLVPLLHPLFLGEGGIGLSPRCR